MVMATHISADLTKFDKKVQRHQSRYCTNVLGIETDNHQNHLPEDSARRLLNYFDGLEVRTTLRKQHPDFLSARDSDLMGAEHISFNLFAPLIKNPTLAAQIIENCFGIQVREVLKSEINCIAEVGSKKRNHRYRFHGFFNTLNDKGQRFGIGVTVIYTGIDLFSVYEEKEFPELHQGYTEIFQDQVTQNTIPINLKPLILSYITGREMIRRNQLDEFQSVILSPFSNPFVNHYLPMYRDIVKAEYKYKVTGGSFEEFVDAIPEIPEFQSWKSYLTERYIIR